MLNEISALKRKSLWVLLIWIIPQITLLVTITKELNSLFIYFGDVSLRALKFLSIVSVWLLNALDAHDTHEVICWVTQLRAFIVNAGEVVNSKSCFVEIDNLSSSK